MRPVVVFIFHAAAANDAGPLVRELAAARYSLAQRRRTAFLTAGADEACVVTGTPDELSFGERLAEEIRGRIRSKGAAGVGGAIVLGSGSMPLARIGDLRRFVDVAAGPSGFALANNRYSADAVAVAQSSILAELPPLPADNALPRWLDECAGTEVADLSARWRLGVDIDTPLDLIVLGIAGGSHAGGRDLDRVTAEDDDVAEDGARAAAWAAAAARATAGESADDEDAVTTAAGSHLDAAAPLIGERLAALQGVLMNRRAELLVAGRVSAATLRWLESGVACRVRALVEERGMRAATRLAQSGTKSGSRPPRSVLGELLDRDGPESFARIVAGLGDAAVIDTRVLLAHRHGADESAIEPPAAWPSAEDRFASDLLEPGGIVDPWLRALTTAAAGPRAAAGAPTAGGAADFAGPILLGGHTLVNGGLRLLAERARTGRR
jgi:hypothetical protein